MQRSLFWISLLTLLMIFSACAAPVNPSTPSMTESPVPTPEVCNQPGTLGGAEVPVVTQGFAVSFRYYLPPCYEQRTGTHYPVIYLLAVPFEGRLNATEQTPMSLAERLIRSGKLPPLIIIVPEATIGYGYHAALARDLIPFVDKKFRTLAEARARGVGGISHGAAIAARMAFEFPEIFGSVGLLSGGIAASEMERFDGWAMRMPPAQRPRVLIFVGEQDPIWSLTANFLIVLDRQKISYRLERGPGGHAWAFWSEKMETYLLWFADEW